MQTFQNGAMAAHSTASTTLGGVADDARSRILPACFAALLGCLIVGMTGFSHIEAAHNAAHDVRHSNAFPCH